MFATYSIMANNSDSKLDLVDVNDIVQSFEEQWIDLTSGAKPVFPELKQPVEYSVIDHRETLLAATGTDITNNLKEAIRHRDTIVDITVDDEVVGKLIIYNNESELLEKNRDHILIGMLFLLIFLFVLCISYILYLNHTVLYPFQKLKKFAISIANGNLDLPLTMDRNNLFGAFTESFDLMREELAKARENEKKANQSKKELVAQLSHDIKTPVSSIKAISELMQVRSQSEKEKEQLSIIGAKTDQINLLISNMFQATLEELQELKVIPVEVLSSKLSEFIAAADYDRRVTLEPIPDCILLCDPLRLQQVFDNIISNSYKYAATDITVTSNIENRQLILLFKDYGKGVTKEDAPLLFEKYYRGNNATGKSGSGLGLYISRYLMNKMNGNILCETCSDGFIIKIILSLA
jgi:signal transduction histidine kinase